VRNVVFRCYAGGTGVPTVGRKPSMWQSKQSH